MITPHEGPHRMELLLQGMKRAGFDRFHSPDRSGHDASNIDPILAVHSLAYVEFLQTAYARWTQAGYAGDVLPMSYPHRPRRAAPPKDIDGAAGYFCSSSDTVISQTSWQALTSITDCAVSAAEHTLASGAPSFTLTRPPGHHAGADYMSGYCLLNTTAIAAEHMRRQGASKIAILDVDFHHGNGTQDIFYDRDDVLFISLHGEPDYHFPYFWGHKDERGNGRGEGFTLNYPLPAGTDYIRWAEALDHAISSIRRFGAEALVVSLGVDTYEKDPISSFKLKTPDYAHYGAKIAALKLPTTFIMEGGYGAPEIGDNTAGVLTGFMGA